MGNAVAVTGTSFETEVLQSKVPVLVDFWAEWCGPCLAVGPVVEDIAKEYAGKLKVAKVDVDGEMDLAGRFGVASIPTLILFKDGDAVEKLIGAYPKPAILAKIQRHLG